MIRSNLKRVVIFGFLSLFLAQLITLSLPPRKAAAQYNDQTRAALQADEKRRRIDALTICINRAKDNGKFDKAKSYLDLLANTKDTFKQNSSTNYEPGKAEDLVLGFDISAKNGVQNCANAVPDGIVNMGLAANNKEAENYFFERITGAKGLAAGQEVKVDKKKAISNLTSLEAEAAKARDAIPGLTWDVARARIFGSGAYPDLINACFEARPPGGGTIDDGKGDFQAMDSQKKAVGDFVQRRTIDWEKQFGDNGWIDYTRTPFKDHTAHISAIQLGFQAVGTLGGGSFKQDNTSDSSDFYPLGRDFFHAKDYRGPGIVDCHFVKKYKDDIFASNIQVKDNKAILVDDAGNPVDTASLTSDKTTQNGVTDPNSNDSFQCENKIGISDVLHPEAAIGKGLNWLVCNVLRAVNGAINFLDRLIIEYLQFDTSQLNDDKQGYYAMWSTFRFVAVGLLVLIGLVMVISQIIGVGIFDAYTVKKILPRMVAATILITLSWTLCKLAIEVTNIVGGNLRSLMYAPFGGATELAKSIVPVDGTGTLVSSGLAVGGFFVVATTNWLVILSFAVPALIAILVGFIFIILRQLVIVLLVVTAPLAIVAYILPNTDKVWKFWRESFVKALIMYPLIVAFLSIGRIFASLIAKPGAQEGPAFINNMIAVIAYYGPYFAIPATFKFAGGLLGSLSGMANDRGKGLLDRNKKMRQKNQAETYAKTKAGNRFNPNGRLGGLNRGMQTGTLLGSAGLDPTRMRGRINAARGTLAGTETNELLEKNAAIGAVKHDDTLAEATQLDRGRAQIEQRLVASGRFGQQGSAELAESVSLVEQAQKAGSTTAVRGAMALARANSGTGYESSADMQESIIQAAGGNRQLEGQLLAAARTGSERARRPDLAGAGHVPQALAMDRLRATMGDPTSAAHTTARREVNANMRRASFEALGAHAVVSGRTAAVTNTMSELGADFITARNAGDWRTAVELGSQIASVRGAMGSAAPEARRAITDLLVATGINLDEVSPSGQAVSTDEQLGRMIGLRSGRNEQEVSQEIRTRAGLYDAGGGNLTPAQIRARQQMPPP